MNTELTKIRRDQYDKEEVVIVPPVDIYETDNEYIIKAEMPGIKKDQLEITLEDNELEINGKLNGNLPDEKNLKYSEFKLYNYHRKFDVGETIDRNSLKASLENGILTLNLPKREEVKPRKIEIKAEQ